MGKKDRQKPKDGYDESVLVARIPLTGMIVKNPFAPRHRPYVVGPQTPPVPDLSVLAVHDLYGFGASNPSAARQLSKIGWEPKQSGEVRSDMNCHSCSKLFYALINFDLSGNYEIHCPHCGHIHYRTIEEGRVSEARYHSDPRDAPYLQPIRVWRATGIPVITSSASGYMRYLWLNRSDSQ